MEIVEKLLGLFFAQFGPLGTVCLTTTIYAAWLHYTEKEDHKKTRELVAIDAEKRNKLHQEFILVLGEMKLMISRLAEDRRNGKV